MTEINGPIPERLEEWEKDLLLKVLLRRMTMETRGRIMLELPGIYNRLHDADIVQVTLPR